MGHTKIEWTDVTVNPFPGCRKISPGCQNCYAERMAMRLKAMGQMQYQDVVDDHGWTGRSSCAGVYAMRVPGKGKMIFVESMGDLFFEGNPFIGGIDAIYGAMLDQPQHTFQVLTKRPERALKYYQGVAHDQAECGEPNPLAYAENIWFGWTAEDQPRLDERTPFGLQVPAAVRFISAEPLLGPIRFGSEFARYRSHVSGLRYTKAEAAGDHDVLPGIDWVIVGCESGPKRRPCDTQWVADIYGQCVVAGVPCFVKQIQINGEVVHDAGRIAIELSDYCGQPISAVDIRQFPRKAAEHQIRRMS